MRPILAKIFLQKQIKKVQLVTNIILMNWISLESDNNLNPIVFEFKVECRKNNPTGVQRITETSLFSFFDSGW